MTWRPTSKRVRRALRGKLGTHKPPAVAVCVDAMGFDVSLTFGEVYVIVPDPDAEALGMLRVIDDTGEAYVYPAAAFITGGH